MHDYYSTAPSSATNGRHRAAANAVRRGASSPRRDHIKQKLFPDVASRVIITSRTESTCSGGSDLALCSSQRRTGSRSWVRPGWRESTLPSHRAGKRLGSMDNPILLKPQGKAEISHTISVPRTELKLSRTTLDQHEQARLRCRARRQLVERGSVGKPYPRDVVDVELGFLRERHACAKCGWWCG